MSKTIKKIIFITIIIVFTTITVSAIGNKASLFKVDDSDYTNDNFGYIEDQYLNSSKFTQKSNYSQDKINDYLTNYQIRYEVEKLEKLGFVKTLENSKYLLYFENDSYSIVLINKETGFTWSSRAEFQEFSDGNNTARNLMNSGLWIDYVRETNVNYIQNTISLYSATKTEYYPVDEVEPELRPYLIKPSSYKKNLVEVKSTSKNNQITSNINFKEIKISFDILLTLTDEGIKVNIDNDSIVEGNDLIKITNIYVFPYLGSTKKDTVPGHFVIPDGIGALVKLDSAKNKDFNARFYGNDISYSDSYLPNLTIPIYGIIHLENQDAMYAIVTEGAENTVLQGRFWGSSSNYFRINTRYIVRQVYRTIIDREGNGYDSLLEQKTNSNLEIEYKILTDVKANYVGIATDYQEHLFRNELINKIESLTGNIPINLSFLMSEREKAFFGTKKVSMTSTKELIEIYDELYKNGIDNQTVTLKGYSKDGNFLTTPYRTNLIESQKNFRNMIEHIRSEDNQVFLENSFTRSSSLGSKIKYNNDVAKNISKIRLKRTRSDMNDNSYDIYYLNQESSLKYAKKDNKMIDKIGANGYTLVNDGSTLYSNSTKNGVTSRTDNMKIYDEMFSVLGESQFQSPNMYALKYATSYMNMPITNSQFDYYSDLVPILPVVLKGYIPYFTPELNFNSLGKERLLTLVDFAINPSYVLTASETFKLRHTLSNYLYSTTYSDYKDEIINDYAYVNNALKEVVGQTISSRTIIETGIVEVKYSNNVTIYINYTSKDYTEGQILIKAFDYKVIK